MRLAFRYSSSFHSQVLIIGGGTGGLNVCAQLVRHHDVPPHQIRVIEPNQMHSYQPAWTMVGGGFCKFPTTQRETNKLFPSHVEIVKQSVVKIDPANNLVTLNDGSTCTYDNLVIVTGNRLDWDQIPGAKEALADDATPVASIYEGKYAVKMNSLVQHFKGGKAIFTEPQMPIKCAGAPQKILYLTHDRLRKANVATEFEFHKTIGVVFGVPKYSAILTDIIKEKGIGLHLKSKLVEIDGQNRVAVFENQDTKQRLQRDFDLLHVVPPQVPPPFIKESGLADGTGYVDVNKHTLQHTKYPNIWSLGDSANLPTSKTAAALMSQTPILVHNLISNWRKQGQILPEYQGYTSCPIFTSQSSLLLAEFKYDGVVDETFGSFLQSSPNFLMFYLKKFVFPLAYWEFMSRGIWKGRKGLMLTKDI